MLVRDLILRHADAGIMSGVAAFGPCAEAFLPEIGKMSATGAFIDVPDRPLNGASRVKAYASAIKRFDPDVVFGHSVLPALYGRLGLLASGKRAKFVSVLHSGSDDYDNWKFRWAEQALQLRTDRIVAVSASAADMFKGRIRFSRPMEIVLNGVDLQRFYAARGQRDEIRVRLGLTSEDRLIFQVGRVSPVKQQQISVRALADALTADPRLHFWMAGIVEDHAYGAELERMIADKGLGDRLKFLGPRLDVPDLLSACDVYLMPSRSEAHSIAFLEAMASGPPIVASDIPSFAFAKGIKGVTLVGMDDASALGAAVLAALSEDARNTHDMGNFDLTQTAAAYSDLASRLQAL
jgi:glycosyltransferase involved in cell wall biosynthesis